MLTVGELLNPYLGIFYILCCLVCRNIANIVNARKNNFQKYSFPPTPIINQS